jgi:hypothetical protein
MDPHFGAMKLEVEHGSRGKESGVLADLKLQM